MTAFLSPQRQLPCSHQPSAHHFVLVFPVTPSPALSHYPVILPVSGDWPFDIRHFPQSWPSAAVLSPRYSKRFVRSGPSFPSALEVFSEYYHLPLHVMNFYPSFIQLSFVKASCPTLEVLPASSYSFWRAMPRPLFSLHLGKGFCRTSFPPSSEHIIYLHFYVPGCSCTRHPPFVPLFPSGPCGTVLLSVIYGPCEPTFTLLLFYVFLHPSATHPKNIPHGTFISFVYRWLFMLLFLSSTQVFCILSLNFSKCPSCP